MTATDNRAEFRLERRELSAPDAAFLSGLMQMLAAMYCRVQYADPAPEKKEEKHNVTH